MEQMSSEVLLRWSIGLSLWSINNYSYWRRAPPGGINNLLFGTLHSVKGIHHVKGTCISWGCVIWGWQWNRFRHMAAMWEWTQFICLVNIPSMFYESMMMLAICFGDSWWTCYHTLAWLSCILHSSTPSIFMHCSHISFQDDLQEAFTDKMWWLIPFLMTLCCTYWSKHIYTEHTAHCAPFPYLAPILPEGS